MSYTVKQIENAYGCVIHKGICNDGYKLWTAYDKETGGWIGDAKTLKELGDNIPGYKMEWLNENKSN